MNELSDQSFLEANIISFCLREDAYDNVKNLLTKDMFEGEWAAIWDTLVDAHARYEGDITREELEAYFDTRNPALPASTRNRYMDHMEWIRDDTGTNYELQYDIIKKFWMRNRARVISELSVDIFLGKSTEFGELKRLIESTAEDSIGEKTTYTEIDAGVLEMLESLTLEPDFPFEWEPLSRKVKGLDRGHFGIIFARPETGKTTFCSFLAAQYLKQGLHVAVWGNEEPAIRTKLRIIQSYYGITRQKMSDDREEVSYQYSLQIKPYLHVLDCVGTPIQEIDDWCKINKPDVIFIDQLDKVKINGKFNRGDERLKEIYLQAREIAKRNDCLVWGVSQASAEAEGMADVEYQYLDNSKTGKAGEADLIIGIGKRHDDAGALGTRFLCVSKNKQNGWHGTVQCKMDMYRARYLSAMESIDIPPEAMELEDYDA